MLQSKDYKHLIITPTKSGTISLEAVLVKKGYTFTYPRHTWKIEDRVCPELQQVHMMIRHPHLRLLSMYHFAIVRENTYILKMAKHGFKDFCVQWADKRDRMLNVGLGVKGINWLLLYDDYLRLIHSQLKEAAADHVKVYTYRLEKEGQKQMLRSLLPNDEVPQDQVVKNDSSKHFEAPIEHYWNKETFAIIGDRLDADLRLSGYRSKDALTLYKAKP